MVDKDRTHSWRWFASSVVWLAVLGFFYMGALFAFGGRVVMQKGLLYGAMPTGVLWIALTFVCLLLRGRTRSPLLLSAVVSWLVLTVLGNGLFSNLVSAYLERDYLALRPLEDAPFETVVVLGGGCSQGAGGVQVNSAGERVVLAARMDHAGLAKQIICTGKRIEELSPDGNDPADQTAKTLVQLGVPERCIKKIGGINTFEEMKILGERFKPEQRVGLITSGWHMKRAMRLADTAGFVAKPLPGGFKTREEHQLTVSGIMLCIIPSAEALSTTSWCMREILAGFVGR